MGAIDVHKNNFTIRANTQVRPYVKYFIVGGRTLFLPFVFFEVLVFCKKN